MLEISHLLDAAAAGDPTPRRNCCRWSTTSCGNSPPPRWLEERPGQTLDATALVHEAFLRLVASGDASAPREQHWDGTGHFFAAAAEAMRRILVENARRKKLPKHGGGRRRVALDEAHRVLQSCDDLLLLDDALNHLAIEDATAVELVKLRVFAGLSVEEAADSLGLSRATAYRHWSFARAWLRCELGENVPPDNLSTA